MDREMVYLFYYLWLRASVGCRNYEITCLELMYINPKLIEEATIEFLHPLHERK